ncbi:MAG: hypothetical protein IPN76_28690, partial [Saprospiraceae bacterium]|nr:hypothetical protein [Saprospiraceae bacterium]
MATIIRLSPDNGVTIQPTATNGQLITVKEWFGSNFLDPDFETEKCVAFDAGDLKLLLAQGCQQLVLSKHEIDNKNTLAIAGVKDNELQVDGNASSLVLVGMPIDTPNGNDTFPLDFSQLLSDFPGHWGAPAPISNPSNASSFETQMKNFQKTPFQNNLFRSVNFDAKLIGNLITEFN